jgi:hypothetical protein
MFHKAHLNLAAFNVMIASGILPGAMALVYSLDVFTVCSNGLFIMAMVFKNSSFMASVISSIIGLPLKEQL